MWAKNPTALQDDFWQLFLNLWTFTLSGITQFVYYILPGKESINFYICMGEYPLKTKGNEVKINFSQFIICILSLLIHLFVEISIWTYKRNAFQEEQHSTPILYSYLSNVVSLLFLLIFFYAVKILNAMNGDEIDLYPNYVYFHAVLFYTPLFVIFIVSLSVFYKKKLLRKKVKAELKQYFLMAEEFF